MVNVLDTKLEINSALFQPYRKPDEVTKCKKISSHLSFAIILKPVVNNISDRNTKLTGNKDILLIITTIITSLSLSQDTTIELLFITRKVYHQQIVEMLKFEM